MNSHKHPRPPPRGCSSPPRPRSHWQDMLWGRQGDPQTKSKLGCRNAVAFRLLIFRYSHPSSMQKFAGFHLLPHVFCFTMAQPEPKWGVCALYSVSLHAITSKPVPVSCRMNSPSKCENTSKKKNYLSHESFKKHTPRCRRQGRK